MDSVKTPKYPTREEWLQALVAALRPYIETHGYALPEKVHISCGWPSARALSTKNRRIGECWSHSSSEDKIPHIFISPVLSLEAEVSETVVHELGHASVGTEAGHGGPFRAYMRAVGLTGKPTATTAGAALRDFLAPTLTDLGPYPHGRLDKLSRPTKKQSTRMVKLSCPNKDDHSEPYILRGSRKAIAAGLPTCPCGTTMISSAGDDPEDDPDEEN